MNNELVLKESYPISYSQMDCNLALKPFVLMNFLQDIASKSAENLGFGYSYISQNNLAWFLIKYWMEFDDYPVNCDELTIATEPRGYNKLFAYRSFNLSNNEKLLGKIFSIWSVINLETRALTLVQNAINNPNMPQYSKREDDLQFSKIKPVENPTHTREFRVRYNDLDVNMHANNGNYIVWAFEALPFEFRQKHKIKTLDFMFKKEAKYDEEIISEVEILNNLTIHKIKNKENEDLCLIQCEWK